jgi:hypothetical protein
MFNHIAARSLIGALLTACARAPRSPSTRRSRMSCAPVSPARRRRSTSTAMSWSATARATFRPTVTQADTSFYALMLHPLNDARERQYAGAVPSGSLLMWIDEMYGVPRPPDDKTFGFWPTADSARRKFGWAAQKHMLYRVFSRPQAAMDAPTNPMNEDDTCFGGRACGRPPAPAERRATRRRCPGKRCCAAASGTKRRCGTRCRRRRPEPQPKRCSMSSVQATRLAKVCASRLSSLSIGTSSRLARKP